MFDLTVLYIVLIILLHLYLLIITIIIPIKSFWNLYLYVRNYIQYLRSEYTPHIFVNIWLYIFMWQHWRDDTLL